MGWNQLRRVSVAALVFAGTLQPLAAQADTLDGETLFNQRTCFTCHGKDAMTPLLPEYPKLAGQNAAYLLAQMKAIKDGTRSNGNAAAMRGVMHLVNDAEMQIIADYIASLSQCVPAPMRKDRP